MTLRYLQAVPREILESYPQWTPVASDQDVLFLDEDLVVRAEAAADGAVVFTDASVDWRTFCADVVGFSVPDWSAESGAATPKDGA